HGSAGDTVVPHAEAHLRVVAEVARDAQRAALVPRVRPEELDHLPTLCDAAPRTEAKPRLDLLPAAGTSGHTREDIPKSTCTYAGRRLTRAIARSPSTWISVARTSFLIQSPWRVTGSAWSDGTVRTMRSVTSRPSSFRIVFTRRIRS